MAYSGYQPFDTPQLMDSGDRTTGSGSDNRRFCFRAKQKRATICEVGSAQFVTGQGRRGWPY
jgi:hypothetical protein